MERCPVCELSKIIDEIEKIHEWSHEEFPDEGYEKELLCTAFKNTSGSIEILRHLLNEFKGSKGFEFPCEDETMH